MKSDSDQAARSEPEFPIFAKWFDFVNWFLPCADKLPKKVRFSLTNRMTNLAIDVMEDLTEARYRRDKGAILRSINLKLERLRLLMRLCFEQKLIAYKTYEHAIKRINETGKMLGGWIKQQGSQA